MAKIAHVNARQIFDSRGNPTVEADVFLDDDSMGRVSVPSGASTGSHEAHELRDGAVAFNGKGVLMAVHNVVGEISQNVVGLDASDQGNVDRVLIELDGTENKKRLGANAILAVSLATARAEANSRESFFYEYVGNLSRNKKTPILPMPMCNLINGGKHAANSTDIQEFMVLPVGAVEFNKALQMSIEIFHALHDVLVDSGYRTTVGDEGGFAPSVKKGNREALELLTVASEKAGYEPGKDVAFGIDAASNEFFVDGKYVLKSEGKTLTSEELVEYYVSLIKEFPLISIEDGLFEDDWDGWKLLNERLGDEVQIVGDDLLVTNTSFLKRAISKDIANSILIKVNQIGTLTETIEAIDTAHDAGWKTIVSHRSGETEDVTIAHLAVGLGAGQIKTGSFSRSERVAKYNELLRIEELMGNTAKFAVWKS